MKIVFPVRLDRPVYARSRLDAQIESIDATADFEFVDAGGISLRVSGWDSSPRNGGLGARLTNLSGIRGGELMKDCPSCDRTVRLREYSYRTTNGIYRDQSDCPHCRSNY